MNTVKDMDGEVLQVGDRVSTSSNGECQVVSFPEDVGIASVGHTQQEIFGSLVSVKDAKGHLLTLRVKLSHLKLIPTVVDAKARITTQKYGI